MKNYYFNLGNKTAKSGIACALETVLKGKTPVICCIGTDAVSGDSLGPLVGTMLNGKLFGRTYVYGTLDKPITAKDVEYVEKFLKSAHPDSTVLAIDAALGKSTETGFIKVEDSPVKPGLAVEKNLAEIGNASIIAIVEEKPKKHLLSSVRISTVYSLASLISDGIVEYFDKIGRTG